MLERIHRDSAGVEHFLAEVPELLRQRLHFRALAQRVDGEWQAGDAPEDGAGDDRPEPGETYAHVENFEGPAYDAGGVPVDEVQRGKVAILERGDVAREPVATSVTSVPSGINEVSGMISGLDTDFSSSVEEPVERNRGVNGARGARLTLEFFKAFSIVYITNAIKVGINLHERRKQVRIRAT